MVFLVLLLSVLSLNFVDSYTDAYQRYKQGSIKTLFLENTFFGNNPNFDPCTPISSRDVYVKFLEKNGGVCSGEWCDSSGGYGCPPDKTECYNAMHVISPTSSLKEIQIEYNRNILGNMIMVYGRWTKGLSGLKNWTEEKEEKYLVLGVIFENAARNVIECYGKIISAPTPSSSLITSSSQTYEEWKGGLFKYEDFFMRESYLGFRNDLDLCTPMDKNQYISLLRYLGIECSGRWCDKNGGYSCPYGNSRDCYNLEHIIDRKNSDVEFGKEYNKNILGNYVLAYGKWNQEVGNLYVDGIRDWNSIKIEKKEIYGDIFDRAYAIVKECHEDLEDTGNIQNDRGKENGYYYITFFGIILIVCFFTLGVLVYSVMKFPKNYIYIAQIDGEMMEDSHKNITPDEKV